MGTSKLLVLILTVLTSACAAPEKGERGASGRDGIDGRDGRDGITPDEFAIEIVDPCGKQSDHDEVVLKFSDGTLVAYFQHGRNRFLTELAVGTYHTTDGTKCKFHVFDNGEVIW